MDLPILLVDRHKVSKIIMSGRRKASLNILTDWSRVIFIDLRNLWKTQFDSNE